MSTSTYYNFFHDTSYAYIVRFLFGSSALPYPDEQDLPDAWKHALHPPTPRPPPDVLLKTPRLLNPNRETSDTLAAEEAVVTQERLKTPKIGTPRTPRITPGTPSTPGTPPSDQTHVGTVDPKVAEKAEGAGDHMLVGWNGPNDPDNPQNWTFRKKTWVLLQTHWLCFTVYMGSSIYVGGVPDIEKVFTVSDVAATLGLSVFVAGYGIGPSLWAPLGEIPQIGRMPIYVFTLFIFVMLHIPLAKSTNFGSLLAFRFLTGFFGSPILAVGGATMADMYSAQHRVYGIWLWCYFATMGPVIGPLIGCYAGAFKGWTWTMWEEMWIAGVTFVILFFSFPETNPSAILYNRARRLRKITGNKDLRSQSELDAANIRFKDVMWASLVRPLILNITEPVVLVLSIWLGLVYSLLYLWFESFPIVFIGVYNFEFQNLGLSYLGIGMGTTIATPFFFAWWRYVQEPKFAKYGGDLPPEEVLPAGIVGAILIPVCLFWFGWTSRPSVHWIVPIIGSSLYGAAITLLFCNILDYLANSYPMYAASVLAANAIVRCAFAGSFPIFARALYNTLGIGWASSLLGFLGLVFVPIPIALYFYGPKIRKMSKNARHDY